MNFHKFYVYFSCMFARRICIDLQLSFLDCKLCVIYEHLAGTVFFCLQKFPDKNFSSTAEQALICIHRLPLILDFKLQFFFSFIFSLLLSYTLWKWRQKKGIKSHYNVDDEMPEMIFLLRLSPLAPPTFLWCVIFSLYENFSCSSQKNHFSFLFSHLMSFVCAMFLLFFLFVA